jgi:hypothetical protein
MIQMMVPGARTPSRRFSCLTVVGGMRAGVGTGNGGRRPGTETGDGDGGRGTGSDLTQRPLYVSVSACVHEAVIVKGGGPCLAACPSLRLAAVIEVVFPWYQGQQGNPVRARACVRADTRASPTAWEVQAGPASQ